MLPYLRLCWPYVGPSRRYVGLSWPYLAPMLALWWPMLVLCWPKLTLCCPMLTLCWPQLPPSCPMLNLCSRMLAFEMLTPIAVTEKAEVGRGWGRGGDGWVGGWGGSPYPAVPCYAEGQAICGFSHREVPPMPPTPEIGAG